MGWKRSRAGCGPWGVDGLLRTPRSASSPDNLLRSMCRYIIGHWLFGTVITVCILIFGESALDEPRLAKRDPLKDVLVEIEFVIPLSSLWRPWSRSSPRLPMDLRHRDRIPKPQAKLAHGDVYFDPRGLYPSLLPTPRPGIRSRSCLK